MKITLKELGAVSKAAVLKYGYTEEEAAVILEVLLYAQLRGNNQGVVKLIGAGIPKSSTKASVVEKESPVSAFVNGNQNHAMLVVNQGVDIAISKAKMSGIGVVGVNGINTSSGALGFYARKIANAGMVGIVCSGSMETVAAEGSSEAVLGTNPLAIAVPTESEPMVYDITTAAMAYFGVVEANTAGKSLPDGIAYDKNGNPTNSPSAVLEDGALKTFDRSHKGSGLSVMIQALTGPLMGAYFTGFGDVEKNWGGHFILALDPNLFAGTKAVQEGVSNMIKKIKSTRKLPDTLEIYVPGERGDTMTAHANQTGEIEIEENLYSELKKVSGQ